MDRPIDAWLPEDLAREFQPVGWPQAIEALFAEARRSEVEADELLVERGWEDEPEAPPEPIPFAVRPAPVASGTLDDRPLCAPDGAVRAPESPTTHAKIVTLEALARMVRRRKPEAAPEEQLALPAS